MDSSTGLFGLPEEILEAIIRMATAGPAFACYRDPDIEFGWPHTTRIVRGFREALFIKRSVVLVCRKLWRIGIPSLLETILLEEAGGSKALADALSVQSSRTYDPCTKPSPESVGITILRDHRISSHVKTMLFLPRLLPDPADIYTLSQAYHTILRLCPSLQCIVMRKPETNPLVQIGWRTCGPSIIKATPLTVAHLDIEPATDVSWKPAYLSKTSTASNVRSLRIIAPVSKGDTMLSYNFPSLTHLCVNYVKRNCVRLFPLWKMDNLTHLYITMLVTDDSEAVRSFWKAQKPSITLLHFGHASYITQILASAILEGVPNLRTLEYFHPGEVAPIWRRNLLPQSFERVTIAVSDTCLESWTDYLRLAEQLHEFQYPPLPRMSRPPIVLLGTESTASSNEKELKHALETFPGTPFVEVRCSALLFEK